MAILGQGDVAAPFTLFDLSGKSIALADVLTLYPVLVVFFRSDCALCQWALPQLARYEWTFKGGDLEVWFVTPDHQEVALDTVDALRIRDIHVLLDPGSDVVDAFGVEQLPAAVFVGPDGNVIDSAEGWDPGGFTRIGKALKKQLGWIRGPEFGAPWRGEPCPTTR